MKAGVTFAQFVMMTPFPGTVDFGRWEKEQSLNPTMVGDVPITRYWMIPTEVRPKMFTPHPTMSSDEIRERTQKVWDRFYNWRAIWERSACTPNLKSRIAFMFLSKLYRQMYAGTGISTDSARRKKSQVVGALDRPPLQEALPGHAHAGARVSALGVRARLSWGRLRLPAISGEESAGSVRGSAQRMNRNRCPVPHPSQLFSVAREGRSGERKEQGLHSLRKKLQRVGFVTRARL